MLTRSMCLCVVEEEWERERGVQSLITFSLLLLDCVQTHHISATTHREWVWCFIIKGARSLELVRSKQSSSNNVVVIVGRSLVASSPPTQLTIGCQDV